MNPPEEILSEGTKVITHTGLLHNEMLIQRWGNAVWRKILAIPPHYRDNMLGERRIKRATAGCLHNRVRQRTGDIVGHMAGQHEDLYWIRHYCNENKQRYTIAPYLCSEFELLDTMTKDLFDKEIKQLHEHRVSKEQKVRILAALKRRDDATLQIREVYGPDVRGWNDE